MSDYWKKYQNDTRWLLKRTEIIEAAGTQCTACGATKVKLTVHHGYYKFKTPPWDYENDTLWCLCWPCHEQYQLQLVKIHYFIGRLHPHHYQKLLDIIPDQTSLIQFGVTEAEFARILEEEKLEEMLLFGAYSAVVTRNSDNGPSNAESVATEAEAIFPGLMTEVVDSCSIPDLSIQLDGPDKTVAQKIESWFLKQQTHRS